MTTQQTTPEIGKSCELSGTRINYHDTGSGTPVLLIHGSGPGVSAWANWRGVIPPLSEKYRVIAPDMLGFGYTRAEEPASFDVERWVTQVVQLLDHLGVPKAHVVGNSFGGAIALHLARRHPDRVDKLTLMGAVSLPFPLTPGLDKVWGYTPSLEGMRELMGLFAHDKTLVNDDLIASRYEVSRQRGMDKVYESLFPAPRQRWVDGLGQSEEALRAITHRTLIVHGRDDQVIPLDVSLRLERVLPNADLVVFGNCGHWTQIEKRNEFVQALSAFFG
ncbi:MAG TPA: alpha/beta hydrolase [Ramlibacter sp.]|nr:alpha/beta hydrolase [Ramlibacter sp.]